MFSMLFSYSHFLFCEAQQSCSAHQNYILWFYSLWWMIKGIWHLCSSFIILLNRKSWLDNFMLLVTQGAVVAWRLESWACHLKVAGLILAPAGIEGGDCEWTALSPPSIPWLRCPWARHRTPNCSLGAGAMTAHCSGCVFTVCVCTWMG